MKYSIENSRSQPQQFGAFRRKPEIGRHDDQYEKETDAVADKVMMRPNASDNVNMQSNSPMVPPIQRQEQEDENMSISTPMAGSLSGMCPSNPVFPDFRCFLIHLKSNVDENLYNNAHHFTRIASLYPEDTQMMEDAFFRYGLGVNLLETSFRFLGADPGWATGLSYGTGIGLKAYDFFNNGELQLDIQIPLGNDVNLDFNFDLQANPDDYSDVQGLSTGLGISGHF